MHLLFEVKQHKGQDKKTHAIFYCDSYLYGDRFGSFMQKYNSLSVDQRKEIKDLLQREIAWAKKTAKNVWVCNKVVDVLAFSLPLAGGMMLGVHYFKDNSFVDKVFHTPAAMLTYGIIGHVISTVYYKMAENKYSFPEDDYIFKGLYKINDKANVLMSKRIIEKVEKKFDEFSINK